MILLDTNVVSELWRPAPDTHVLKWFVVQAIDTLYLSAITVAELRLGIALLPEGRRRTSMNDRLELTILPRFDGRVVSFDQPASRFYADLMAQAKSGGRAIGIADGYIAATAASRAFMMATRDVSPFAAAGLSVINPWTTPF